MTEENKKKWRTWALPLFTSIVVGVTVAMFSTVLTQRIYGAQKLQDDIDSKLSIPAFDNYKIAQENQRKEDKEDINRRFKETLGDIDITNSDIKETNRLINEILLTWKQNQK